MTDRRGILIALAVLGAVACGGAGMKSYTPVDEKTKLAPETLLQASRLELEAAGNVVRTSDPETYTVETSEKEVAISTVPLLYYKYSWKVVVADGKLSIRASCRQNSSMNRTKFEDCGEDRPQRVIDEQERLRSGILERAGRLK